MSGVFAQVQAFTLTLILGVLGGVMFHCYQLTIRRARIGRYLLYLVDLIFWIVMLVLVFGAILFINQAEMRLYVLIAWLCGILIYYRYFSPVLYEPLNKAAQLTVSITSILLKGLTKPFKWLSRRLAVLKVKNRQPPPPDNE